jgi:hypothetical protein
MMEKPSDAISSLVQLRSYYQSQYEHYLAKATASKENRERVSLLLQDLSGSEAVEEAFWEANLYEPETDASRQIQEEKGIVLDLSNSRVEEEEEHYTDVDTSSDATKTIDALNQAIEIIVSISESETGKTLHLNYFQKLLSEEMSRSLSSEIVKLYLDEGIKRGYLEKDAFDPNCYRANKPRTRRVKDALIGSNRIGDVESDEQPHEFIESEDTLKSSRLTVDNFKEENSSLTRAYAYKLPPSSKLRVTLLETIQEYLKQKNPLRFSIENVMNYLYSTAEQENWSKETRDKVRSSISNVLSRKAYLNKEWKRIKSGTYQPIVKQ